MVQHHKIGNGQFNVESSSTFEFIGNSISGQSYMKMKYTINENIIIYIPIYSFLSQSLQLLFLFCWACMLSFPLILLYSQANWDNDFIHRNGYEPKALRRQATLNRCDCGLWLWGSICVRRIHPAGHVQTNNRTLIRWSWIFRHFSTWDNHQHGGHIWNASLLLSEEHSLKFN